MPAQAKSARQRAPTKVTSKTLELPMQQGVRIVALRFLADAEAASGKLAAGPDAKALHQFRVGLRRLRSWLRTFQSDLDSVKKKDRRALRDIAASTNGGRDADVQIAWLAKASKGLSMKRKRGAEWLSGYIAARKGLAGEEVDRALLERFATMREHLATQLGTFVLAVDGAAISPTLGVAIAARLAEHADALGESLGEIRSVKDEEAAHEGRIAAKRLRYLVEPAAPFVKHGEDVVATLKSLQDELGALHDAHMLTHALRDALEETDAPRPALTAIGKRLDEEADRAFRRVKRDWLGGRFVRFRKDVIAVAKRLDEAYSGG